MLELVLLHMIRQVALPLSLVVNVCKAVVVFRCTLRLYYLGRRDLGTIGGNSRPAFVYVDIDDLASMFPIIGRFVLMKA